jgi:hypothetical protein
MGCRSFRLIALGDKITYFNLFDRDFKRNQCDQYLVIQTANRAGRGDNRNEMIRLRRRRNSKGADPRGGRWG